MLCWFARDVTAAMLVAKNKSNSLLYFHVNYRIDPQHGHLFTWLQSKNSLNFGSLGQDDKLRRMLWVELGGVAVVLMGEVEGLREGFSPRL